MLGIGSFFERFKSRELEEISFRSAVVDAVKGAAGFQIQPEDFSYSNGVVSFSRLSPAARSALFIKKSAILDLIKGKTKRKVADIR